MACLGSLQESDVTWFLRGRVHPKGPEQSKKETVKPGLDPNRAGTLRLMQSLIN